LLPVAEDFDLAVLPYYGLAKGFLTGKYRPGGEEVRSDRAEAARAYLDQGGAAVLEALDEVAAAHDAPVAAVALAWLRAQPRVVVGGLFVGHGTQKLFGWFGGYGPDGPGQFFESIGLRPGRRNAMVAGASEAGGGALLALGLFTPLAGALLTGVMVQAVRS